MGNQMLRENYPRTIEIPELGIGVSTAMTGPIDIITLNEFNVYIPVDGTIFDLKTGLHRDTDPSPIDVKAIQSGSSDAYLWLNSYEILTALTSISKAGGSFGPVSWAVNFEQAPEVDFDGESNFSLAGSPTIDFNFYLPMGFSTNFKSKVHFELNENENQGQKLNIKVDQFDLGNPWFYIWGLSIPLHAVLGPLTWAATYIVNWKFSEFDLPQFEIGGFGNTHFELVQTPNPQLIVGLKFDPVEGYQLPFPKY